MEKNNNLTKKQTFYLETTRELAAKPFSKELDLYDIEDIFRKTAPRQHAKNGLSIIPSIFKKGKGTTKRTANEGEDYWRQDHLCVGVNWLILDIEDHNIPSSSQAAIMSWVKHQLQGLAFIAYSSWSHGDPSKWKPNYPRFRVVVPLSETITVQEYKILMEIVVKNIPGVDPKCINPSRIFYTPRSKNPSATVDPWIISSYDGWELDISEFEIIVDGELQVLNIREEAERKEKERKMKEAELRRNSIEVAQSAIVRGHYGIKEIKSALEFITDVDDYELWLKVGMALHDYSKKGKVSDSEAFDAWVEWSDTSDAGEEGCDKKWETFNCEWKQEGSKVTLGSVIHYAVEGGWKPPSLERRTNPIPGPDEMSLMTYISDNFFKVYPESSVKGEILWSTNDREEGERFEFGTLLQEKEIDFVWRDGDVIFYDTEIGLWREVDEDEIRRVVGNLSQHPYMDGYDKDGEPILKRLNANNSKVKGVFDFIKSYAKLRKEFFENRPASLVTNNTALVWHKGDFIRIDGTKTPVGLRATNRIPVDYNSDTNYEYFENFLMSCFVEGERDKETGEFTIDKEVGPHAIKSAREKIRFLKQYVGAVVFGKAHETQKAVFLKGPGGGGKSVFISVIEELVGRDNLAHVSPQDMAERFLSIQLKNKILNTVADVPKEELLDTGLLKQVLGGDAFSAEAKYKDATEVVYKGGTLFSCNDLPVTKDDSDGFFRRFVLVDFPFNFTKQPEKIDYNLKQRLIDNLDAIALWAIDGFKDFIDNGIQTPSEAGELEKVWRMDNNSVLAWAENYRVDEGQIGFSKHYTKASECYAAYSNWCRQSGLHPFSTRKFYQRMNGIDFIDVIKRGDGTYYSITL